MTGDKDCRKGFDRTGAARLCCDGFALDALEPRMLLAAVSWDGGGNGTAWEDPLNWSGNVLPAAVDDVTIDVPTSPAIALSSGVRSVRSLVLAESLTITGGTLAVTTTAAVSSTLTVDGGILAGGIWDVTGGSIRAGTSTSSTLSGLSVAGEILLPGGANLRISGGLTLSASSVIRLSGASSNNLGFMGSTTLAAGTISLQNSAGLGFVGMIGTGTLTIGAGATVAGGRGVIGQNVLSAGNAGLVNQGTITASASGATLTINTSGAGTFSNPGSLSATGGGTLTVSPATWNSAGSITVAVNSTVTLSGGWASTGSLNVDGGTLALGGAFSRSSLSGLVRSGGVLNLTGTLTNAGGTLTLSGSTGSLNLQGGTISGGVVAQAAGAVLIPTTSTLSTLNGVTVQGDLLLDTGTNLRIAGQFGMAAGSLLRLGGSGGNTLGFVPGATLISGEIVCEAVGGLSTIGITNTGAFTVASGAIIRGGAATIGSLVFGGTGAVGLTNLGLIHAENPAAELKIAAAGGSFTNTGIVEASAGATLNISGPVSNYSGQTLSGGTWRSLSASNLAFGPGAIRTSNAAIFLEGNGAFAAISGLETTNGSLTLSNGHPFNFAPALGVFTIGPNGSLSKQGTDTVTIPAAMTLDNRGTVAVEGGILSIAGPVIQIVGLNFSGGTWRISNGATLDIPWATIRSSDASISLAGSAVFGAIASLAAVHGTLSLADGYVFNFAPLSGTFVIESGATLIKTGTGATTIPAGITLDMAGTVRVSGGVLTLAGPIVQVSGSALTGGSWVVSGSGQLSIPAAFTTSAASITLDGPSAVFASISGLASNTGTLSLLGGRVSTMSALVNTGTVSVGGRAALTLTGLLDNSGLVSVQDGTLRALGGGASSGELAAGSRGFVELAGNHQFTSAAKLSGGGAFAFTGGTAVWSGTMTTTGKVSFEGAAFVVATALSIPGRTVVTAGSLRLDAAASLFRTEIDGGMIDGVGHLTVVSRLDWIGGAMTGAGRLLIASGGTLFINAASPLVLDRVTENAGTVLWASGSFQRLTGPVTNLAGATFSMSDAGKWGESGPPPEFMNQGTIIKTSPAAASISAVVTNTGLIRVEGGTLTLDSGGDHTGDFLVLSGARLKFAGAHTLAAGSDITGAGAVSLGSGAFATAGNYAATGAFSVAGATATFHGTFSAGAVTVSSGAVTLESGGSAASWTNSGRLDLRSKILNVTGAFSQGPAGMLALRMDGRLPDQFGRVTAAGAITLSGGLEVSWGPGYVPTDATPFDFLTGATRTGTFAAFVIQPLGIYRTFILSYQAAAVRLWVYAVGIEGP